MIDAAERQKMLQEVAPRPRSTIVWIDGPGAGRAAAGHLGAAGDRDSYLGNLRGSASIFCWGTPGCFPSATPPISAWEPIARDLPCAIGRWGCSTSLAIGIVSAMLLACFIGALAIRRRGVYFAMISLAFAQMLYFIALSPLKEITRGEDGLTHIPDVALFSIPLDKPRNLYYFVLAVTVLMLYLTWRILQSPFRQGSGGIPRE